MEVDGKLHIAVHVRMWYIYLCWYIYLYVPYVHNPEVLDDFMDSA